MSKALRDKLDQKIPRDVIKTREAFGGRKLDYLDGYYVISRMNEVFGQGNWGYTISNLVNVFNGNTGTPEKPFYTSHYIAIVKIEVPSLEGGAAIISDTGYGDGYDKQSPGKAHELASKEAVTDALKRACKSLGMSMGLALYDKDQTNVEEAHQATGPRAAAGNEPTNGAAHTPGPVKAIATGVASANGAQPSSASANPGEGKTKLTEADRKVVEKSINAHLRTIVAKKIKTMPELKGLMVTKFQKQSTTDLNMPQLESYLGDLQTMLK